MINWTIAIRSINWFEQSSVDHLYNSLDNQSITNTEALFAQNAANAFGIEEQIVMRLRFHLMLLRLFLLLISYDPYSILVFILRQGQCIGGVRPYRAQRIVFLHPHFNHCVETGF